MPGKDGTGPLGRGPGRGRGAGRCRGAGAGYGARLRGGIRVLSGELELLKTREAELLQELETVRRRMQELNPEANRTDTTP